MADKIERIDCLTAMCLKLAAAPINAAALTAVALDFEADAKLDAWLRYYERSRSGPKTREARDMGTTDLEKRRLAWLRDFVRRRSLTSDVEIWDLKKKAWVDLDSVHRAPCPDVIRGKVTFDQINAEIVQLIDPANYYTEAQRLEWLKSNIRRRPDHSVIEMWDAKQSLWLPLSDAELTNVYPVYVRGYVSDRRVGLEFVQVLESLVPHRDEDPVVKRALQQRTAGSFYSDVQRRTWLRDYTRRNLETDSLEIWHVLHDAWAVVTREALGLGRIADIAMPKVLFGLKYTPSWKVNGVAPLAGRGKRICRRL